MQRKEGGFFSSFFFGGEGFGTGLVVVFFFAFSNVV